MQTFLRTLLLLVAATLSGCLDYTEDIRINSDGSARLKIDVGISEAVLTTAEGVSAEGVLASIRTEFEKLKAQLQTEKPVTRIDLVEYTENSFHYFRLDIDVSDFMHLNEIARKISDESAVGTNATFRIEQKEGGRFIFKETYGQLKDELTRPRENIDDPWTIAEILIANSVLADYFVAVRLHAPKVLSSNGKLDDRKKSVEWKMSLAELFSSHAPREFKAEGQMPLTWRVVDAGGAAKKATSRNLPLVGDRLETLLAYCVIPVFFVGLACLACLVAVWLTQRVGLMLPLHVLWCLTLAIMLGFWWCWVSFFLEDRPGKLLSTVVIIFFVHPILYLLRRAGHIQMLRRFELFECPNCHTRMVAPTGSTGDRVTCSQCARVFEIPVPARAVECPSCKIGIGTAKEVDGKAFCCPSCQALIETTAPSILDARVKAL